jgi:hypothetical protein
VADNTTLNTGAGGDVIASDDISGVKFQRMKLVHGADGVNAGDVATANPLPVFSINTGRTMINFSATAAAAGTTTTETAITLTRSGAAGAATTAAVSFTPTTGKRFRITSMTFASRGHATATIQSTTFNFRANSGSAVTTSSNIMFSVRSATPATASAWDRFFLDFGDSGPEIVGDGTLQMGVTAAATYVTNAPTWDVLITGYEY